MKIGKENTIIIQFRTKTVKHLKLKKFETQRNLEFIGSSNKLVK